MLTEQQVEAQEMENAQDMARELQSKYNLAESMCKHALWVEWVLFEQRGWGNAFVHKSGSVAPYKRSIVLTFLQWMRREHAAQYAALDALTVVGWTHA